MSDYMKGYSKRNRRRRSAYSKYSNNNRKSMRGQTRRNGVSPVIMGLGFSVVIVLIAVAVFAVFRFVLSSDSGKTEAGATGSSVVAAEKTATGGSVETMKSENPATAIPGSMSEAAASVGNLSPSSVASPTPAPRSKAVALTFDDGPSTVNTPKILATLKKYNAHATFFVVGTRVSAGADVLKQEIAQGCEIANHSWDHANLSRMNMKQVNKEYDKTAKLVKNLTGVKVSYLRPPYGSISDTMRKKLKHPMVLWSVDTLDWKSRNAKAVLKEVKKQVSDGDIILMHDIHPSTAEAIEKVIPWLVKQDYDILTVSELMERKGIKMKNGKAYGSAK